MCTSADEGRASDDENTLPRTTGQQCFTRHNGHHPEDVVGIVLQQPIGVLDIRLDVKKLVWRLSKMMIFRTKAVFLDKVTAALLMAYCGVK